MSLVDIVLYNGELLHCPLANIDQCLDLGPCCAVQSLNCLAQLVLKLTVVSVDEAEYVDNFK